MRAEEMERGLLETNGEEEEGDVGGSSLQAATHDALSNPRVRAMLAAFREGGPERLAGFVNDPECDVALASLRGRVVKPRVLVGVCGSVAAVKVKELVAKLKLVAEVKVIATQSGRFFLDKSVELEPDENWKEIGDPIRHIDLRKWAQVYLVAPASANTLAKIANGLCDDLVSCVARAWDFGRSSGGDSLQENKKVFIVAPAMNTCMWSHPVTARHMGTLRSWGIQIIPPVSKTLACGDTGIGALAPVDEIVRVVVQASLP